MSLLAITGLLLMAGLFAEASQHGLEPTQVLGVIPLLIPMTLPYTLPATTLFATCVVYGRLAHDNEILAIKASGVNILTVAWPAVFLGIVLSSATSFLYYETIPLTHHMLRTRVLENVEEFLYSLLKRKGKIELPSIDYVIEVKHVDGKKLNDATFMRRDAKDPTRTKFDIIAKAAEARLEVDLDKRQIIVHMWNCHIGNSDNDKRAFVANKKWTVDLPEDLYKKEKNRTSFMTWNELFEYRDKLIEEREEVEVEIASHESIMALGEAPTHYSTHVKNLEAISQTFERKIRSVDVEIQKRPALSLGCLCFVLVGCPVGIWLSRSDYLSAFISCFLTIVFLYYTLLLCGQSVAGMGDIPIPVAIWAANAAMGVVAVLLFRQLLKH